MPPSEADAASVSFMHTNSLEQWLSNQPCITDQLWWTTISQKPSFRGAVLAETHFAPYSKKLTVIFFYNL